jgi:hypothetical protein
MPSPQRSPGASVALAALTVLAAIAAYRLGRRALGLDRFAIGRTRPVVSRVDGLRYRVHEGHAGPGRAADVMAEINARIIGVMRYLRNRYVHGPDGLAHPARRAAAERLLARYNPEHLAENSPRDPSGDTSYTLDKGALVALCLRERDPRASGDPRVHDFHDLDTLTFVALHEMAHIAIDDVDHPKRFWQAFRFILESAEAAGVFTSTDYARHPRTYCGIPVDYNPRFDSQTASI